MKHSFYKLQAAAFVALLSAATLFSSVPVCAAPSEQASTAAESSVVSQTQESTGESSAASPNVAPPAANQNPSANMQRHYFDNNLVNAGLDTGYKETNTITKDDPHFGWQLGKFNVTGYTRITNEDTDNPIFLKTVGDKVTLWFKLDQDINRLNGDQNLKISEDSNGTDEYFGIKESNFKRGTLIVKHSDYQNQNQEPVIYRDYLTSKLTRGSDTTVELFEEGDYEVALDYEIEKTSKVLMITKKEYYNYRIFFKFSVRNGNCMVYPFDTATRKELSNSSITPNGFYLDLAKSRYLDIDIKKEILKQGADGLTEDVRFNSPAKDGDQYTSEGIYTIKVTNRYTKQQTEKKIYVGNNNLLKAYVTTGLSIPEIRKKVDNGAEINDDGTIVTTIKKTSIIPEKIPVEQKAAAANSQPKTETVTNKNAAAIQTEPDNPHLPLIIGGSAAGLILILAAILVILKIKAPKKP